MKLGLSIPYNNPNYHGLNIYSRSNRTSRSETPFKLPEKSVKKSQKTHLSLFVKSFPETFSLSKLGHILKETSTSRSIILALLNKQLIICNTFFQHKPVHQKSWMHPGSKTWHILDYTFVNKKFRSSVEDVRVHCTAAGTIGTDHHLLRIKLKFHLKSRRKANNVQSIRLNRKKLKDEQLKIAFQAEVNRRPSQSTSSPQTIDDKYADFVNHVRQATTIFFQQDMNNKKQKEWLTDEILDVVNKRKMLELNDMNWHILFSSFSSLLFH